nr:O-antigen ligase family protein [Sphingomicrobium astaxanthinifaciens]
MELVSSSFRPLVLRSILIALLVMGFVLCYSRSALLVAIVIFMVVWRPRSEAGGTALLIARFGVVFLAMLFADYLWTYFERGHGSGNLVSLGGRTTIWQVMVGAARFEEDILWGYGYQMLSAQGQAVSDGEITVTMAHNTFIQTYLGLGGIGLLLHIIFWSSAMCELLRRGGDLCAEVNLYRSFAVMMLVYSLVEFGIFGPPTVLAPIYLVILFHRSQLSLSRQMEGARLAMKSAGFKKQTTVRSSKLMTVNQRLD